MMENFWNPVPGLKFSGSTCSTVTLLWCNYWYICQIQLSIWETSYIQHRSHCKWTIGSPDMAIFVGRMLTKSTFGEMKDFRSKFKKIISYIWVVCFLIVGSHCMLHGNRVFFSIPYLPPSKPALLTLFFREIWKLFFVAHFGYSFIVYILVDYCLFMPQSKERYKEICPGCQFLWIFQTKPLKSFFAKKTPKTPWLIRWFSTWEAQIAL